MTEASLVIGYWSLVWLALNEGLEGLIGFPSMAGANCLVCQECVYKQGRHY
jgi:hypothetical protein